MSNERHPEPPAIRAASTDGEARLDALHFRQREIVKWLAFIISSLFVADVALQSLDAWLNFDSEAWLQVVRFFDLNAESSLPTWFAVVQLFAAALVTAGIAIDRRRIGDQFTRHWFLLAFLVTGFSLDEAAQIHDAPSSEPLRDMLGTSGLLRYPWVIAALVSAVILTFVMFRFVRSLPRSTRRQLILSAFVFGSGAIGMEMLSGWYADTYPDRDLGYQKLTSVEEILELAGGTILIYALLGYARDWIGETRIVWDGDRSSRDEDET